LCKPAYKTACHRASLTYKMSLYCEPEHREQGNRRNY
jgi:hypothetical protein